ncbi:MAG TPA: PAS domain S-box protein, partial [Rhodothermales bacterium]|nr:PAS domain S-box protein [Rhodothermales bacterium]
MHDETGTPRSPFQNIYRLVDAISRTATLQEIFGVALDSLLATLGADRASVLLFDADGVMRFKAWRGLSDAYRRAVEGHSPWTRDEADARPIVVCDAGADPSLGDLRGTVLGEGIGALAFVPLAERGRLLGKFMVYYDRPHRFTGEEVQLAQLIAAHVAFAIGRHETIERLSLYHEIIAHSSEAVAIIDPQGFYLEQNPAHRTLVGYTDGEIRGRTPAIHLGEEVFAEVARALSEQGPYRGEVVSRTKDGRLLDIELSAFTLRDGSGAPVCHVGIKRDITERKRAQEALRASESRLRAMFGQAAVGIVLVDCEGRLLEVNKRFCEILGRPAEELCARTCEDLTHPDDWFCNGAMIREVAEGERAEFTIEKRYARGDGSWVWVRVAVSPLRDAEGRVERLLAVVEDIDARKRAEAEREQLLAREKALRAKAEEANRLKDEFLATVSHELRTPLTAILGWAQMLESTPLDSDTARQGLGVIRRNADQQKQIVEDILDVSRAITGKLKLELGPVEVGSLVQAALDAVGPSAKAKGIRLRSAFDPVAVVRGDGNRLRQVVWNLLSNAVKFTPAGGEVRVSVERLPACARIEVSDTGQGISPEFLPHVFDRFRQADGSTTRAHGGLGLGLAIVRHLVELHGGTARAYSAGEGRGATFTVELPLPVEAEQAAGAAGAEGRAGAVPPTTGSDGPPPPLVGLRVLLVDDNEDTLEMLSMFMRRAGAEVTTATSAGEALGE